MSDNILQEIADAVGGKIGSVGALPDGSGFATMSMPLPKDHWLYAPHCEAWDSARDCNADTPLPILSPDQRAAVLAAMRWAIRGATMNGKEMDFDPDALALNAAYALCGPVGLYERTSVAPNAKLNGGEGVRSDGS